MATTEEEVREALMQSFGLTLPEQVGEERIIAALAFRVEQLMAGNPDQLCSLLYRLDISEKKIKIAMADGAIPIKIAVLIYERQMEKIVSRKHFKSDRPDGDLAW